MATYREIYDQHGSVVRRVEYNPYAVESRTGGEMHFVSEQECDDIITANKQDSDADQRRRNYRLVGRVPVTVADRALREGWFHDDNAWDRYLRENPAFQVGKGHR